MSPFRQRCLLFGWVSAEASAERVETCLLFLTEPIGNLTVFFKAKIWPTASDLSGPPSEEMKIKTIYAARWATKGPVIPIDNKILSRRCFIAVSLVVSVLTLRLSHLRF